MTGSSLAAQRTDLAALAAAYGVATGYYDALGAPRAIGSDVLRAILEALGASGDPAHALATAERERWARLVEPVTVAWDGVGALRLQLPARLRAARIEVELAREEGADLHSDSAHDPPLVLSWRLGEAAIVARGSIQGDERVVRRLRLPALDAGYYRARVRVQAADLVLEGASLIIAAPRVAYHPASPERAFGVLAPAYSLHSAASRGIGTLGDLRRLVEWSRGLGARTVGTLPLLATFHDDPAGVSPYSPVSRLAWDELFLDVDALPERAAPRVAAALADAAAAIEAARASTAVNYAAVDRALLPVLAAAADAAEGSGRAVLERFSAARPDVEAYARFRGARPRLGRDWRRWPAAARAGTLEDGAVDPEVYRVHRYAQYALDGQLQALADSARTEGGRGVYLDLPLGTHREGFDAWRYRHAFVAGLDTGAPPDRIFSAGQNWQFAPTDPGEARRSGYAYFRASVRAHLRFAGLLRIDHVMGIHRLYVIPRGAPASEGAYLEYRPDEAWAILSLESHRARAMLIGEDLGTVPRAVRRAMRRHGVGGSYVAQYEVRAGRPRALPTPPRLAVASLNTHDMPPFAGWLRSADLDTLARLGFATDTTTAHEKRTAEVAALARFLGVRANHPPADAEADADSQTEIDVMLRAGLDYLGRSAADLVLVSLDDLMGATAAQNVPGTTLEHPNWQRRARLPLEDVARDGHTRALLGVLRAARVAASTPSASPEA